MDSRQINIAVGKANYQFDTSEEAAIHSDLDAEMDSVAARISYFGELLAAVFEESIKLDAAYRAWRASESVRLLNEDPKVSEWKVKAAIESADKFRQFKDAIAKVKYNQVSLESLIKALIEKSPNLRSKGARLRAELESTDMNTARVNVDQVRQELRQIIMERKGK